MIATHVHAEIPVQETSPNKEHLEKAAQTMGKDSWQSRSFPSSVGIFCPNGRIEAELLFPLMPVLIGMVLDVARQAFGGQRALGVFVDLVDPSDAFAGEHAQDMVRIEYAVAEGHAKGDGFTCDGVLRIHLAGRDDVLNLSDERIIEPFIGIEVEHPIGICLLECKIALR